MLPRASELGALMEDGAAAVIPKGSASADPLIGRIVNDRFKIVGVVARGGMGKIYRAEQAPLGRVCALKVLSPTTDGNEEEFQKRFFLEASIASKLTHPNTVTIFDYGRTEDDIYYMAMEYLDGQTLLRAIRSAGSFPESRAAHIARQICRALREAHSLGVIHRDLKPANVFLVDHGDEPDFVKLLDFGLVKNLAEPGGEELTRVGTFVGSPKYMSPEQIRGERVDARTDVYALGIILYEMITGRVPFDGPGTIQTMVAQVNEPPPPLRQANPNAQFSPALEEAIARCLAKSQDGRFRSMDDVLGALKSVGRDGVGAPIEPHVPSAQRSESRIVQNEATGSGSSLALLAPSGSRLTVGPPLAHPSLLAAPTAETPPVERLGRLRSTTRLVVASACAAVVVVVSCLWAFQPSSKPAPAPPTQPRRDAPVAAESAPATAAPIGALSDDVVNVRINSEPDGAQVTENGAVVCASTPCDVAYAGASRDPARLHKLIVTLSGYRNEVKSVRVGDSPVIIRLLKLKDPVRP